VTLFLRYLCEKVIGHRLVKVDCDFCRECEAEYGWLHWRCRLCGEPVRLPSRDAA